MRRMITVLAAAASAMLIGALGVPVLLSSLAPRLGLRPEPLSPPRTDPARWGLPWGKEVRFRAADGISLHGWWIPASRAARACGTVILFHGRSANITTRAGIAAWLSGLGYNSLLFDYRGYGASGGSPSEAGLYRDGLSAYRFVRDVQREQPARVVLLGQSMGTAIATEVAVHRPAASLVLSPLSPMFPPSYGHVCPAPPRTGRTGGTTASKPGARWPGSRCRSSSPPRERTSRSRIGTPARSSKRRPVRSVGSKWPTCATTDFSRVRPFSASSVRSSARRCRAHGHSREVEQLPVRSPAPRDGGSRSQRKSQNVGRVSTISSQRPSRPRPRATSTRTMS